MRVLKLEWIDTWEDFKLLEPMWNVLLAKSGSDTPFLTYEWMDGYWRHFHRRREPFILTLKNGSDVVGLAPMAMQAMGYIRGIEFLGGYHADYQDIILLPEYREEGLRIFLRELNPSGNRWDMIDLKKIRRDSPNYPIIRTVCSRKAYDTVMACYDVSPYLEIGGLWKDYLSRLKKKLVKDTERQIRRIERLGELKIFEVQTPGKIDRILDYYHQQKGSRRYTNKVARDSFGTKEGRSFLKEFVHRALKNGWLKLCYLSLDDLSQPLAISISFLYGGRFLYWLPSINNEYLPYSPGRVFLYFLLQDSFEQNLEGFDFLSGSETYKYQWLARDTRLCRVSTYNHCLRGSSWKIWKEQLRPRLRQNSSLTQLVRKGRKILQHG